MLTIRPSHERGHFDFGWLDTFHTFSFGDYHDPGHMGFRSLRVINEDTVQPGRGFGEHGHREMEIITWIVQGELAHKDSTGGAGVIRPGDVQRMTAGRGIRHSEFNPSRDQTVHLLQIWLLPARPGLEPSYEQKHFDAGGRQGRFQALVSPDGADGALRINQDARLYATVLSAGSRVEHPLGPGRHAWVQVVRGALTVNGASLTAGDGAAISDEPGLAIEAASEAEALLFDLA